MLITKRDVEGAVPYDCLMQSVTYVGFNICRLQSVTSRAPSPTII